MLLIEKWNKLPYISKVIIAGVAISILLYMIHFYFKIELGFLGSSVSFSIGKPY